MQASQRRLLIGFLCLFLVSSLFWPIHAQDSTPVNSSEEALLARIDAAEAAWTAQDIETYTLVVEDSSVWNGVQVESRIRDGRVGRMHATCILGTASSVCEVLSLDPDFYTIPGILSFARKAATSFDGWQWLEFDADLDTDGAGTLVMAFNEPETYDEEWWLSAQVSGVSRASAPTQYFDATATAIADQMMATRTAEAITHTPEAPVTTSTPMPSPTPVLALPPTDNILAWIDAHEAAWNALEIINYTVHLRDQSLGSSLDLWMRLRGGNVIEITVACDSGEMRLSDPCQIPLTYPHDYAISDVYGQGLFAQARDAVEKADGLFIAVEIQPDYHYPAIIRLNEWAIADDERVITVVDFQPLP